MNRRIITQQLDAGGAQVGIDTYFDRVIKYIPADVIAAWTAVTGLITGSEDISLGFYWGLFIVFIALTAGWTYKQTSIKGLPLAVTQIAFSSIAFIVWVFALGGPFANLGWYTPVYGSILLILYTLIVPLINPKS